ncbi:MAG: lipid-A-disaccharide synthase [Alphaproteobacteria bacterium]
MKLAVLTGEPSGDLLAGSVVRAVQEEVPDLRLIGVGGERLAASGLESRYPLKGFAVNGLVEVLPHLPRLLLRIEQLTRWLLVEQPDAVLTVDAPDLTLRIAKALRARGYGGPLIHLVAPTVWAWKPERAEAMAGFLDHVLCLFPFEPDYFTAHGLPASFVGHPILARSDPPAEKEPRTLLLLPGSRMSEVRHMVPLFRETVAALAQRVSGLRCLVPTVETTRALVTARMGSDWPTPIEFRFREPDRLDAFASASVALAASGTVALELAQANVAGVIAYRLAPATHRAVLRQTQLQHFSLINILGGREIMPELLQDSARADALAPALERLLTDDAARTAQIAEQRTAFATLALPTGQSPAKVAAETLLSLVRG